MPAAAAPAAMPPDLIDLSGSTGLFQGRAGKSEGGRRAQRERQHRGACNCSYGIARRKFEATSFTPCCPPLTTLKHGPDERPMKQSLRKRVNRKIAPAADLIGSERIGIPDQTGPIASAFPAGMAASPRDIGPDRRWTEHLACIQLASARARRPMRRISETCMSSRHLRCRPYPLRCWNGQVSAQRWPGRPAISS